MQISYQLNVLEKTFRKFYHTAEKLDFISSFSYFRFQGLMAINDFCGTLNNSIYNFLYKFNTIP